MMLLRSSDGQVKDPDVYVIFWNHTNALQCPPPALIEKIPGWIWCLSVHRQPMPNADSITCKLCFGDPQNKSPTTRVYGTGP